MVRPIRIPSAWRGPSLRKWYQSALQSRNAAYDMLPTEQPIVTEDAIADSKALIMCAVAVHTVLAFFLAIIVFVPIWARQPGTSLLTTNAQRIYTTFTAILASAITAFTVARARRLSLSGYSFDVNPGQMDVRRARTVLGIGLSCDTIWYADLAISAVVIGLVTSAIVAGLAPTPASAQVSAYSYLHRYHMLNFTSSSDLMAENWCYLNVTSERLESESSTFRWYLGNSTWLMRNAGGYNCDSVLSTLGAGGISYVTGLTYANNGARVATSAIGTPSTYGGGGRIEEVQPQDIYGGGFLLGGDGPLFQSATQCFPTMVRNPVTCVEVPAAWNVKTLDNATSITVESANCTASGLFSVTEGQYGVSISSVCPSGLEESFGQARIMIGTTGPQADVLAKIMYNWNPPQTSLDNYTVICAIDIAPSVELRKVSVSRLSPLTRDFPVNDAQPFRGSDVLDGTFVITGSDSTAECRPVLAGSHESIDVSHFLTADALAAGAAASWPFWHENANGSGLSPTLMDSIVGLHVTSAGNFSFSFVDSQNILEDVLGLVSGIALGNFWGTPSVPEFNAWNEDLADLSPSGNSDDVVTTIPLMVGTAVLVGHRIGSGSKWALLYALPSLFVVLFFTHRLVMLHRMSQAGKGLTREGESLSENLESIPMVQGGSEINFSVLSVKKVTGSSLMTVPIAATRPGSFSSTMGDEFDYILKGEGQTP